MFKLVLYHIVQGVSHQLTPISCSYLDQLVRYTTLNFVGIHLKIHILTKNLQNMFCSLYMYYETVQSSHGLYSTKCRLSVNTNALDWERQNGQRRTPGTSGEMYETSDPAHAGHVTGVMYETNDPAYAGHVICVLKVRCRCCMFSYIFMHKYRDHW